MWWTAAVRLLRRARWKTGALIAHSLFIVLQLAGLIVIILSRRPDFSFELSRLHRDCGLRVAFGRPAGPRAADADRRRHRRRDVIF